MIDVLSYPPPDWSIEPSKRAIVKAMKLNERGRIRLDEDRLEEAERLFMQSIEIVPLFGMAWFNLGLVYKRQSRWEESAACNQRSIDRGTSDEDPAFWNLGLRRPHHASVPTSSIDVAAAWKAARLAGL